MSSRTACHAIDAAPAAAPGLRTPALRREAMRSQQQPAALSSARRSLSPFSS
ncbi:hypothetical protein [Variovorax sp. OV329]|uniref:hypothetical protein n=1 Tax=Variovorax sp. OV329 TaxID=1882825 RepID=UPI001587C235|nr:hypothetical protein [Variovorax sp. OV329]